jgi:hypothetical protein
MFVDDHRPSRDCNFVSHDAGFPLSSRTEKFGNLRCCWLPGVERLIGFLLLLVGPVLGLQSLVSPKEISRLQGSCSQRISAWIHQRISYGSRFADRALAWHGIGDPIQEFKFPQQKFSASKRDDDIFGEISRSEQSRRCTLISNVNKPRMISDRQKMWSGRPCPRTPMDNGRGRPFYNGGLS